MPVCKHCNQEFFITDKDNIFYQKINVPPPTHCYYCRQQRRLAQGNALHLFKRHCDATGKEMLSCYPPESSFKVFSFEFWWSDQFDATAYGVDFDFNRPFFDQFRDLNNSVPRMALLNDFFSNENSDYTNHSGKNKNCYLIFDSDENRDCFYSYGMNKSRSSSDCYRVQNLELCYEVLDSTNCYNCAYISECANCMESAFLFGCTGAKNCLFCVNLNHKEYHVFNQPVSKEEFTRIRESLSDYQTLIARAKEFEEFRLRFPYKFMHGFQTENVIGNHVFSCKDCYMVFDSTNMKDGAYASQMFIQSKDCLDVDEGGLAELCYETNNFGYNSYDLQFCTSCFQQVTNLKYCTECVGGSEHLFGCAGLKRKKYCILNKQYSEQDYELLTQKIIEHMKKTGEWGEFFPISTSPVPYNLSQAQEYYPLTKEQAVSFGYSWHDDEQKDYQKSTVSLPSSIKATTPDILNVVLSCTECGKNYKIIPQELELHRQINLPLSPFCFFCRNKHRSQKRTPRAFWPRICAKCNKNIFSAYAPTRPEIIYCEECYLKEVF
ncbi:MAG: hypothetical protein WC897_00215 [Candidatus Gracilibacteria bacterium]